MDQHMFGIGNWLLFIVQLIQGLARTYMRQTRIKVLRLELRERYMKERWFYLIVIFMKSTRRFIWTIRRRNLVSQRSWYIEICYLLTSDVYKLILRQLHEQLLDLSLWDNVMYFDGGVIYWCLYFIARI